MAINDLALFGALKTRMNWLQTRQRVLAENVANADTPGFLARDIGPVAADRLPARPGGKLAMAPVRTDPAHMSVGFGPDGRPRPHAAETFEIRPSGNSVVLEEEMMKVAETQLDYQTATSLYSRGMGMIKTALGRRG